VRLPSQCRSTPALGGLLVFLLVAGPESASAGDTSAHRRGVVVEKVSPGSAADAAGIRPGDLVVTWFREASPPANPEPARGELGSPFDLADVELEQAPRGPVTLSGTRGQEALSWTLPPGPWGLEVRPLLVRELLSLYEEGRELVEAGRPGEGVEQWRQTARSAREGSDGLSAAWLLLRTGLALAEAGNVPDADAAFVDARAQATGAGLDRVAAEIAWRRGEMFRSRRSWDQARESYEQALTFARGHRPSDLGSARGLVGLGAVAEGRSETDEAARLLSEALATQERLAPGSLVVASSLNNLGIVAGRRGDLVGAAEFFRRSLAIRERLAPDSADVAGSLNNLANMALDRGDLTVAEEFHRRSLAIKERLAPESLEVAASLNNLGNVAMPAVTWRRPRGSTGSPSLSERCLPRMASMWLPVSTTWGT